MATKSVRSRVARFIVGLTRPSPEQNARHLRARGESLATFVVREATRDDIPKLARLHVATWNTTYPFVRRKPSLALREAQWRAAFQTPEPSWFCFVVERPDRTLVAFAKGTRGDHPAFAGELNKIYVRRDYQRLGLGRRLVGHVVRRFFAQGTTSVILFADPGNPSCAFFERLGADRVPDEKGEFHGAYGWRDLEGLAARCPIA